MLIFGSPNSTEARYRGLSLGTWHAICSKNFCEIIMFPNWTFLYDKCKLSQWNLVENETKANSHEDSSDLTSNIMLDSARDGVELDFYSYRNRQAVFKSPENSKLQSIFSAWVGSYYLVSVVFNVRKTGLQTLEIDNWTFLAMSAHHPKRRFSYAFLSTRIIPFSADVTPDSLEN